MLCRDIFRLSIAIGLLATFSLGTKAAETVVLDESNWGQYAPDGKEVDCILGDHVLASDRLVAVIAKAVDTRHANLTVKDIGGSLIDLTYREEPSDQLSCYYPHGGSYTLRGPIEWPSQLASAEDSARLAFAVEPNGGEENACDIVVGYELVDGTNYITLRSLIRNETDSAQKVKLADGIRADGEFKFGRNRPLGLWWCQDEFWKQAYGVAPVKSDVRVRNGDRSGRHRLIEFRRGDSNSVTVEAGESVTLERRVYVAKDTFGLVQDAARLREVPLATAHLEVVDSAGPVAGARVKVYSRDRVVASGETNGDGSLDMELSAGREYSGKVSANGRTIEVEPLQIESGENQFRVTLPPVGKVAGAIVDESGEGVPCRIAFNGKGVDSPNFGPDSAIHGVRNLWHTHDGSFEVALLPGTYELVISRGPEYDAIIKQIEVEENSTTRVEEQLIRSVDTSGWISAELHSHSSPSGDNTSSQRGRVLNLLVEHLEFIPCTEHQRVTTYDPHLEAFDAADRVLTCTGMELTGKPLPLNHQNAFPLVHRPRQQDGGGPTTHPDPEVQIERIAMWDDGSDKVVQINHPNIAQMVGDRDLDGTPDEGFRNMFYFADVIEVHPPGSIFDRLEVGEGGASGRSRGNTVLNWIQLLNLGYRVPGVVNTDAHWNYYGSGWLRNYVRSSSDNPASADLKEICHALEDGHVVMTNGPFLEVKATAADRSAGPGEDLESTDGMPHLHVRVQCPNWLDVNRIQVFVNGRPDPRYNFTRTADGDKFTNGVVKFEHEFEVNTPIDAHLIVVAAAEDRKLGIVYGEDRGEAMPVAISNPIFVDIDGNGFQANGDTLGVPLPVERDHEPTHGHDHPHPHR